VIEIVKKYNKINPDIKDSRDFKLCQVCKETLDVRDMYCHACGAKQ